MSNWNHQQQTNYIPQKPKTQQQEYKKQQEDEDTLSLDSERSQGFINEPVNSWPAWTVENNNNTYVQMARYPVTYSPQQQTNLFQPNQVPTDVKSNPAYSNSFIPSMDAYNRGPVFHRPVQQNFTPPTYFSRGPVTNFNYQPPVLDNQPQRPQQPKYVPRKG